MNETNTPLVSIRCITYNHEKYIRDALEGFVMQKTNFKFEAIVHDDASTDNTAAIIQEYAEKYPEIIKPIFETENQYSKHDGSLTRIMNAACKGKYIALCEGDDYWIDPYKLQKQVNILENHPEYSMVFHNATVLHDSSQKLDESFSNIENRNYTGLEIFKEWTIPTASVMLRREIYTSDIYIKALKNKKFIYGDIILFLSCAHQGILRGMSETMSVYRRHEGGVSYNQSCKALIKQCYHNLNIYKVFGNTYKTQSIKFFCDAGLYCFLMSRAEKNADYKLLLDIFRYNPKKVIRFLINRFLF